MPGSRMSGQEAHSKSMYAVQFFFFSFWPEEGHSLSAELSGS